MDTHAEVAENFMGLMQNSTNFQVDYYFSNKILKQLNVKESSNIFKTNANDLNQKIADNNSNNEIYDLIIIGTAHRYFKQFLDISAVLKTAIIVHNLNFFQLNATQLFLNIFKKETIYRLKLLLREGLLKKNKVYRSAKQLLVLDENLIRSNKNLQYLPLFSSLNLEYYPLYHLSIVIPGNVSQARRDYKKVLSKIEDWSKTHSSDLEIVFLGKAEGEELIWLQDLEKKKISNLNVIYFKEKVPQDLFDEYMRKASYLWCPLQISTTFFSNEEIYGTTKISGIIGDAIKYQKIAFLPKEYPSNFSFINADNEDLKGQILSFSKLNNKYNFEEFSKQKVQIKLEKALENLIKT